MLKVGPLNEQHSPLHRMGFLSLAPERRTGCLKRESAQSGSEVFSTAEVAVFELCEHEGCPGDFADFAGADGDVLERAPAPGEQGEAAFAQAAQ